MSVTVHVLHVCFSDKGQPSVEGAKSRRGPAKSVCPYNKSTALHLMRDEILGLVHDIEQLLKLGKEFRSCPYYSTRLAIPPAQVQHRACCSVKAGNVHSVHCVQMEFSGKYMSRFDLLFISYIRAVGGVALSDGTP